ncbi:MAG: prepilin-type N-terminal cleavage/methylation domain-containing protein [Patescibacteria group bacterium]
MPKSKYQNKGFTLMEVIVSVGIITTVLVTVIGLITFSISGIRLNKSKTIAFGLAQEGLELVKNIRDNNWLSGKRTIANWRDGLEEGDHLVQYNLGTLMSFSSVPLKIDTNGFYQHDGGSDTIFYRKINIQYVDDDQIKITVQITWQESGRNQILSSEVRFYNWLKES